MKIGNKGEIVIYQGKDGKAALVVTNRELIERFEKKIQTTLARIWGEEAN